LISRKGSIGRGGGVEYCGDKVARWRRGNVNNLEG